MKAKYCSKFADEVNGSVSIAFKLMCGRQIKHNFCPEANVKVCVYKHNMD